MTLDLVMSHVDYAKPFLLSTKTRLPRLSTLRIDYENLVSIAEDFTSNTIHQRYDNVWLLDLSETAKA